MENNNVPSELIQEEKKQDKFSVLRVFIALIVGIIIVLFFAGQYFADTPHKMQNTK